MTCTMFPSTELTRYPPFASRLPVKSIRSWSKVTLNTQALTLPYSPSYSTSTFRLCPSRLPDTSNPSARPCAGTSQSAASTAKTATTQRPIPSPSFPSNSKIYFCYSTILFQIIPLLFYKVKYFQIIFKRSHKKSDPGRPAGVLALNSEFT